jgi:predicted nuclease of predicted toxin-antitoxin system
MRVKLDENLSRHLKPQLSQEGHEVTTAEQEGLLGRSDIEIGAAAKGEERVLFTLDLDFGDLRKFAPGSHPGVVLFRPQSMGPSAVNRFILEFVKATDFSTLGGCTIIVDPTRVRIRRPPLDTENPEWEDEKD